MKRLAAINHVDTVLEARRAGCGFYVDILRLVTTYGGQRTSTYAGAEGADPPLVLE